MNKHTPTIKTARLILRPPIQDDLASWSGFMADEKATLFLGGAQPPTVAWRWMAMNAGSWVLKGFGMFSVIERDTGRWIGRIGPWQPEGWPGLEIGYGLISDVWGKGYGYEAAAASIDWALDNLGWPQFIHTINPKNVASAALARKLGSTNQGPGRLPAPLENETIEIWGQTAEAWRESKTLNPL
jgi:RimJ/RimL family protein N-acetyltransferase